MNDTDHASHPTAPAAGDPHAGGDRKPGNERTGVDKAMKQFAKTEAENDGRAPSEGTPASPAPDEAGGTGPSTQPPASTAPADAK